MATDLGTDTKHMKYQAILFDLDGTLLPMHEPAFVACFYRALVDYVAPVGASFEQVGEFLQGSLAYVIANDGSRTNRQAFIDYYDSYQKKTGLHIDIEDMERFYATDFDAKVRVSCGCDPEAAQLINKVKDMHIPIIVATNPFFPRVATHTRLRWAGLNPSDFAEITTYEDYHYCKPNLKYYQELFERTGLNPQRCLMVGNNVDEDMMAEKLGCDTFLVLRNLINARNADVSGYKQGTLGDLMTYLGQ